MAFLQQIDVNFEIVRLKTVAAVDASRNLDAIGAQSFGAQPFEHRLQRSTDPAAIGVDRLSSDITSQIAAQEQNDIRDFFRFPESP